MRFAGVVVGGREELTPAKASLRPFERGQDESHLDKSRPVSFSVDSQRPHLDPDGRRRAEI